MKLYTIAENINYNFTQSLEWELLFEQCENNALTVDQDFQKGITQFNFEDDSCITVEGENVTAYQTNKV